MSKQVQLPPSQEQEHETKGTGPSLLLMYTVLAFALIAAMAVAAMIVWPFHLRH